MFPSTCGECGGRISASRAPFTLEVRHERVDIDGVEHGCCDTCGEVYLDGPAIQLAEHQAIAKVRATRGLLTPDGIRSLRSRLGVSQAGLERLLGTGPKTVVRWEKGTVCQSATADRLMRLLDARPELVSLLAPGTAPDPVREGKRRRSTTR